VEVDKNSTKDLEKSQMRILTSLVEILSVGENDDGNNFVVDEKISKDDEDKIHEDDEKIDISKTMT